VKGLWSVQLLGASIDRSAGDLLVDWSGGRGLGVERLASHLLANGPSRRRTIVTVFLLAEGSVSSQLERVRFAQAVCS
jgi:hypothetical protein